MLCKTDVSEGDGHTLSPYEILVHRRCLCEFTSRMSGRKCLYCGEPAEHFDAAGTWQRCSSCPSKSGWKFTGYPGA